MSPTCGRSRANAGPAGYVPNAIVYGSGHVPLTQMIRAGVLLDLGCGFLAWLGLLLLLG